MQKEFCDRQEKIDTTRDVPDVRLNYIIDKKWVLRFCNAPDMTEKRMGELNRLIGRYRAMGFKCPAFIADDNGNYLHPWKQFLCYLSEYIDRPLASDIELNDKEQLIFQVEENVALFAETYRDVDLSDTMGMYSLFELSPFDIPNGMDEKQDNFNALIRLLRNEKEDDLANQLVNLAGFDYDEKQTTPEGAKARLDFAIRHFRDHISRMLRVYHATEKEQQALIWYAWIVMVAQWPNFCFFKKAINDGVLKKEICELLSLIVDLPDERLLAGVN